MCIQVSEWYKEGRNGGGFYQLVATVLAENGQVECVRCGRGVCVYTNVRVVKGRWKCVRSVHEGFVQK